MFNKFNKCLPGTLESLTFHFSASQKFNIWGFHA